MLSSSQWCEGNWQVCFFLLFVFAATRHSRWSRLLTVECGVYNLPFFSDTPFHSRHSSLPVLTRTSQYTGSFLHLVLKEHWSRWPINLKYTARRTGLNWWFQVRSISLNWPLFPTRPQILSDGNAWKEHENFRAMSVMTEMTFSRPFSYHAPHVAEFFLVSRDSSCLLTNDKNCNWRLSLFCW